MTKREHKQEIVNILQEILAQPNARVATQNKLYKIKATLLTKRK